MALKVAMVTTWNVRCGIASYSKNLSVALANRDCEIYIIRVPRFGHKIMQTATGVARKIPDDVDIIHLQHEYGLWQEHEASFFTEAKLKKIPIVTTMHGIGNWKLDPVVHSNSDQVITHNEFCCKRLGYSNMIIPHGATPYYDLPSPDEAKKSLGIPVEAPIVGYCGYISEYKGVDILVDVMKSIPEAALLVGGGWFTATPNTYISQLQQQALKSLQGRCRFLGYVSEHDLPRVYAAMEVLVYPSRYATESGALIMALSYGRPVIASRIGPFKEKEKAGALITFKSFNDLRVKIRRVLKSRKLQNKMGREAYKYAEENSWDNVAEKHVSLYNHVLERAK